MADLHAAIETAAAEHCATSGANSIRQPTPAQRSAGNYKKARITIQGFPVRIENPKGSYREGTDKDGQTWRARLSAHYGYIVGTIGADGDPMDCFVGPWPEAEDIYVINQRKPGASFDEHKVVFGVVDEDMARRIYQASYEPGWKGFAGITRLNRNQLRWWLRNGNMRRPLDIGHLPYTGAYAMDRVTWDGIEPQIENGYAGLLYQLRMDDANDGALLEVPAADEIDAEFDDVKGKRPTVFGYSINLDERGSFRADVRDEKGKTVFEILAGDELGEDESSIFEDGYMRNKHDLSGLLDYLIDLKIAKKGDHLVNENQQDREIAKIAETYDSAAVDLATFDALVVEARRLNRISQVVMRVLNRFGGDLKVDNFDVAQPRTYRGVVNVVVTYSLSDGQKLTVFFHNPDTTPRKLKPTDELISWKWLLNKKDVTILVAPERGRDLDMPTVARRVMGLAARNSGAFVANQAKSKATEEAVTSLRSEVEQKEQTLAGIETRIEKIKSGEEVIPAPAAAEAAPSAPASSPDEGQDEYTATYLLQADKIKALSAEDYAKAHSQLEEANLHPEALVLEAKRHGDAALVEAAIKHHEAAPAGGYSPGDPYAVERDRLVKSIYDLKNPPAPAAAVEMAKYSGWDRSGSNLTRRLKDKDLLVKQTTEGDQVVFKTYVDDEYDALVQTESAAVERLEDIANGEIERKPIVPSDDSALVEHLVQLIKAGTGEVGKIATSDFFTFPFEGEDALIFTDELRAKVEAALGEKVKEVTLPGLEGQLSVVPESYGAAPSSAAAAALTTEQAEAMGKAAFEAGRIAAPAMDPAFMEALATLPPKTGRTQFMASWSLGWHTANAAKPVPGVTDPETLAQVATEKVKREQGVEALSALKNGNFIGGSQHKAVLSGMRGEEKQFFYDKMAELAKVAREMPKTYGQDGKGDEAIAYLHYFTGGSDWYITEKDSNEEVANGPHMDANSQAFGFAILNGDIQNAESGYINIGELVRHNAELDFHWKPKTLAEIKRELHSEDDSRLQADNEREAQADAEAEQLAKMKAAQEAGALINPAPAVEAPQSRQPSARDVDLAFLKDVAAGSIDFLSADLASRLEAVAARNPGDAEIETALGSAANAYQDHMIAAAQGALAAKK